MKHQDCYFVLQYFVANGFASKREYYETPDAGFSRLILTAIVAVLLFW